ncbi:MAG: hypothetical protein V7636_2878 [Actinomycetota bacterium]
MKIEPLDPASERDLADAAAIETAYCRAVLEPDEPARTVEDFRARMRIGRTDCLAYAFLAREGERPIGMSHVQIDTGRGNEHMAWMEDLYVLPEHRRKGVGRALLDENIAVARAADRTLLISAYAQGDGDGAAFADAIGCRFANTERQNRALTAGLDRSMLESWRADAPAGYSLVQYSGRCPDDLVERYVAAEHSMNDAPRTESLGDFTYTVASKRLGEAELETESAVAWFAGAIHDDTGELAGFTELIHRDRRPWIIEQEDTVVVPAHRGHAIGRWLKAVNALRLLDEQPEVRVIETWNDGSNKWMLAINDAMGFRPVVTWIEAELDL